ncbi:MAG: hypothetical protein ABL949_12070 [Fimbriimonadaceae bacterium]
MEKSSWAHNWKVHVLVVFGILGCLWLILLPVWRTNGYPLHKVECLSNLKQLGTSTAIYLGDNDDRMPLENWMDDLYPFVKSLDLMECPLVTKEKKRYGYALKIGVVGIKASTEKEPERTATFFETDALGKSVVANLAARSGRHLKRGSHVGYLDTHVRFVPLGDPVR